MRRFRGGRYYEISVFEHHEHLARPFRHARDLRGSASKFICALSMRFTMRDGRASVLVPQSGPDFPMVQDDCDASYEFRSAVTTLWLSFTDICFHLPLPKRRVSPASTRE